VGGFKDIDFFQVLRHFNIGANAKANETVRLGIGVLRNKRGALNLYIVYDLQPQGAFTLPHYEQGQVAR
jgi:hypothetical protein